MSTGQASPALKVLIVTAAPKEAAAVAVGLDCLPPDRDGSAVDAGNGFHLLRSGVGKVNAAIAITRCFTPKTIVINLGVCGALPGPNSPPLHSIILASACTYAD